MCNCPPAAVTESYIWDTTDSLETFLVAEEKYYWFLGYGGDVIIWVLEIDISSLTVTQFVTGGQEHTHTFWGMVALSTNVTLWCTFVHPKFVNLSLYVLMWCIKWGMGTSSCQQIWPSSIALIVIMSLLACWVALGQWMWCTSNRTNIPLRITIWQRGKKAILVLASNVSPTTIVTSLAFLVLCLDLGMTKRSLSWIQTSERF